MEVDMFQLLEGEDSVEAAVERLLTQKMPRMQAEMKKDVAVVQKRKRKPRWPKGFDPKSASNPAPDPERWLPKWERKQYRKQAKKKGYLRGGPAQGFEMKEVESKEVHEFGKEQRSTAHVEVNADKKRRRKKR